MLVTETLSSELLSYVLTPVGVVDAPDIAHTLTDGWPDRMALSAKGDYRVALTAGDRIDVIDAWGRCIGEIALPAGSLPSEVAAV